MLLLIHNERPGGSDQPRSVLSPLIVLLAASAWERFVYKVGLAVGEKFGPREAVGRLDDAGAQSKTCRILATATASLPAHLQLPRAWTITFYESAYGKRLNRPVEVSSADSFAELARRFDHYRELRNGVAHRVLPDKMLLSDDGPFSDAGRRRKQQDPESEGLTINTSIARMVLAAYLQLIDQSIALILEATQMRGRRASRFRLPPWWFDDDQEREGVRPAWPGCLWGGTRIPRRFT